MTGNGHGLAPPGNGRRIALQVGAPAGAADTAPAPGPRVRVVEGPAAFEVTAEVPGLSTSDLEVLWFEDGLRLRCARPADRLADGERLLIDERPAQAVERTIKFSVAIDASTAEAHLENGLLHIKLPKAAAAQPRRIEVRKG